MKNTLFIVCLLAFVSLISAHEFWLQPNKYTVMSGEKLAISFRVGEGFKGDNWSGNNEKVAQLLHYLPNNSVVDIASTVTAAKGDSLQIVLQQPGYHMITYEGKNSFIELAPEKFNEYLKEDGLTDALAYRKANNELEKIGKEYYKRSVKTIVLCKSENRFYQHQQQYVSNLPLDIIPTFSSNFESNEKHKVFVQVNFMGKPFANKLIRIWCKEADNKVDTFSTFTNKKGKTSFAINKNGEYMISTVHMVPNTIDTVAQWQSYWASTTFYYSWLGGNFFIKKNQ